VVAVRDHEILLQGDGYFFDFLFEEDSVHAHEDIDTHTSLLLHELVDAHFCVEWHVQDAQSEERFFVLEAVGEVG